VQMQDDYATRAQRFLRNRIVPGFHLAKYYPELGNSLLVCVTETMRRDQIDALVKGLE